MRPKPDQIKSYNYGSKEYFYSRRVHIVCKTDGNGLWSDAKRKVIHHKIDLIDGNGVYTNLRVYFNKKYWDIEKHGLIYTDKLWLECFISEIKKIGFKHSKRIDYSEQGMQGNNYVDLDIDENFQNEFFDILYTEKEKMLGSFAEI